MEMGGKVRTQCLEVRNFEISVFQESEGFDRIRRSFYANPFGWCFDARCRYIHKAFKSWKLGNPPQTHFVVIVSEQS